MKRWLFILALLFLPLTASAATFTRPLTVGSQGSDVTTLQKILITQGFLVGSPTGYFGPYTRVAVMNFQKAHGLQVAGTVGPQTRSILNKVSSVNPNQALIDALLAQVKILQAKIAALLAARNATSTLGGGSVTNAGTSTTVNNYVPPVPPNTAPAADTTPPSTPTNLAATAASASQINLTWTASTDNVAVTGYKVFRGGVQVGTSVTNNYSDSGLTASTQYSYTVSSYDSAANNSSQSLSTSATTQASPGGRGASTPAVVKNIKTDFSAACNGTADDTPAFMAFNTWAKQWQASNTGLIELDVPSGSNCKFLSNPNTFSIGIKKLLVVGYGATFNTLWGGGFGIALNSDTGNIHIARTATVSAGANSITLTDPTKSSWFTPGSWAIMSGFDTQGSGYPPNPEVFEYVQITSSNPSTGVVTFSAPLQYSYASTWPQWAPLASGLGGPASLTALDPTWDTEVEYRGLTIDSPTETYTNARIAKFTDVTYKGCETSGGGNVPTSEMNITLTNVTDPCQMEVDKMNDHFDIQGGTYGQLLFQSSGGANLLTINNATIGTINGTPKKTIIANSTIGTFIVGSLFYGKTDQITCTNCQISSFIPTGTLESSVDTKYAMSNGVVTLPNSSGTHPWAFPGTNAQFAYYGGAILSMGSPFHVLDVTQDANNTYVKTSLTGGFPSFAKPNIDPSLGLSILTHPAPSFTCTNCTGSAEAIDYSGAPAGAPFLSYSKRTWTGDVLSKNFVAATNGQGLPLVGPTLWGKIKTIKINVSTPYTGSAPTLTLNALGAFGTPMNDQTTGAYVAYNPVINLKVAGERDITPTSVSGAQSGDTITVPGPLWFESGYYPTPSANISGESSSVWPIVTIEIVTDQGVVNLP